MRETWFDPWVGKIPWRREGYPLQYSGLENGSSRPLSNFPFHFNTPAPITTIQFSAPPPSSHTEKGSPGLQNFRFLKISKPVTSLKSFLQTKFTFIRFLWNLINHWSGEDEASQKASKEKTTSFQWSTIWHTSGEKLRWFSESFLKLFKDFFHITTGKSFSNFLFYTGVEQDSRQCGDSFRWTAKGLSHTETCSHSPPNLPQSRVPPCCTAGPCWWSTLKKLLTCTPVADSCWCKTHTIL